MWAIAWEGVVGILGGAWDGGYVERLLHSVEFRVTTSREKMDHRPWRTKSDWYIVKFRWAYFPASDRDDMQMTEARVKGAATIKTFQRVSYEISCNIASNLGERDWHDDHRISLNLYNPLHPEEQPVFPYGRPFLKPEAPRRNHNDFA